MVAQAQEHAETSQEYAEKVLARGLAELPEVAEVYYTAEHDQWRLIVLHDYKEFSEGVAWVTCKVNEVERKVPHLYIESVIIPASQMDRRLLKGEKLIYRRQ